MKEIEDSIEKNTAYGESVRLLMPRIARSLIYSIRSKKDSIHVKETIPTFMDAYLDMCAINWIISELVREFSSMRSDKVQSIIRSIMLKNYSLMQTFEGTKYVVKNLGAEAELLLILQDSLQLGISRTEIGEIMKNFSAPTISNLLKKMQKERKIYFSKSEKYYLTATGETVLSDKMMVLK